MRRRKSNGMGRWLTSHATTNVSGELREKRLRSRASGGAEFGKRAFSDIRDELGDLLDVGGFATLAAIGHGREVGAVGLEHEALERHGGDGVTDGLRVLERDDAGET